MNRVDLKMTEFALMGLDAEALGIPAGKLIAALRGLWDLEKEYALRKAAVLGKYRRTSINSSGLG